MAKTLYTIIYYFHEKYKPFDHFFGKSVNELNIEGGV